MFKCIRTAILMQFYFLQLGSVSAFAQTLRRYTSLNHLAQAARAVLQNTSQINQMLTDLNRVDFANVQVYRNLSLTFKMVSNSLLFFCQILVTFKFEKQFENICWRDYIINVCWRFPVTSWVIFLRFKRPLHSLCKMQDSLKSWKFRNVILIYKMKLVFAH